MPLIRRWLGNTGRVNPTASGRGRAGATRRRAPARRDESEPGHRRPARVELSDEPRPGRRSRRADQRRDDEIPPWVRKAIFLFFAWAVGLLIAYWVINKLHTIILMLLVALFLSLAMEPPVDALGRRGWRRGNATALVGGVFLLATVGFFAAFGSVAFSQASQLVNNSSHYVHKIVDFLNGNFGTHINPNGLIHNLQSKNGTVQKFARNLAKDAPNVALTIGKGLLEIIVTFVFAFYLTADAPRVRRAICTRLPPRRQEIVLDTWELAVEKTGAYLYSRALQALACIAAVWVFLFVLGIPSSLALAIWVGIVSQFVPAVGTYIALILPALVALVYNPVDAVWVVGYLVAYQQFENYVLGPRIARFTLHIHPALTIGTVFAGALLLGPVGALLALPATAVIQGLISTYTDEQEVIETQLTAEERPARRRRVRLPPFSLRPRKVGRGRAKAGRGASAGGGEHPNASEKATRADPSPKVRKASKTTKTAKAAKAAKPAKTRAGANGSRARRAPGAATTRSKPSKTRTGASRGSSSGKASAARGRTANGRSKKSGTASKWPVAAAAAKRSTNGKVAKKATTSSRSGNGRKARSGGAAGRRRASASGRR